MDRIEFDCSTGISTVVELTPDEIASAQASFAAEQLARPIPNLTPRQVRLVLNVAGLRDQVETAIASADKNTKDMWQYSSVFIRTDPILVAMATALGITSAQLDQLFIQGATL
jgi:hypothetical protein